MGRDILAAGMLGALAVIVITFCHPWIVRAATWPRRYLRARGYELEQARHTYAALLGELERPQTYATVTIPRAQTAGDPPWPELEDETGYYASLPDWDPLSTHGALPDWAEPGADRVTAFGINSGSSGSDYGKTPPRGAWPAPADDGTGDAGRVMRGRGPEACGPPAPAPAMPENRGPEHFGISGEDLGPLTATWDRLLTAWADDPAAPSVTLEGTNAASSPEPVTAGQLSTGPGRDPMPGPDGDAGTLPRGAAPSGPGWAPTRLGTLFDAVMAAEVSAYIQDQNRDVTLYLERLLGMRW